MTRPLIPGLLAEGESDEIFLSALIARQLTQMTEASDRGTVFVEPVQIAAARTVADRNRVCEAAVDLAGDCHLLLVHNDHRERRRAEWFIDALGERVSKPVVPLVPIKETEAWMLADKSVWQNVSGANLEPLPGRPRDVERIPDPKAVLHQVIPPRPRRHIRDYFEFAGDYISLEVIARVPAYAAWVGETEKALKGLGYI
jgi:Domain of unknown function (DUF4276)